MGLPVLLKQRMMEVVVTTGAMRCVKLQSNHHHQQHENEIPFTAENENESQLIILVFFIHSVTKSAQCAAKTVPRPVSPFLQVVGPC